ncbi:uncharacterized protein HMPREF1541_10441 [Cyphellophora europaea CBS 101466]|uniref:Alpha/beta hydrolase fold-3 domain-containing protein n=1 Tax=Cyphellophora europaea (strain CBS 101466) TaxID=1220924 RepID=W2S7T9_CYPE1|nr:uncharacterized protein HMPREF1541_10441 [Cyphellophora europaea CBS 101466]ETN44771.1 hypothetical protein HMPREF1541_10441 [Cyphellophora europaea CBS 101466]
MSPLSPEDSAMIDRGFRAFYHDNLWYYPYAATQDNLALTVPWERAGAVLDPSEALTSDAMPVHSLGPKIKVKEYGPVANPRQILIWLSGGGWQLALGFPIISIGYTREPFPAPLQTTYDAIDWVKAQYGAADVIIAGVSSGANLAIVAALHRYSDWIQGVCLVAPSLDNTEGAQRRHIGVSPWFTTERMEYYQRSYVPDVAARRDCKISPSHTPKEVLSRSAKKFSVSVYIMGADILRDEAQGFVERLFQHGYQGVLGHQLLTDLAEDIQAIFAHNLCPGRLEGGMDHQFEDRFDTDTELLQFRLEGASKPLGSG